LTLLIKGKGFFAEFGDFVFAFSFAVKGKGAFSGI
jgi:hypothetical protein